MNKTIKYGLFALLVVGLIFSASIVSAYRGDYSKQGPNFSEERHTAMENAFEANDYTAWRDLMTQNGVNPRVLEVVNEDNFETFVQAHEAGINGDYETASALRAELGLNNGNGLHDGSGMGQHQGRGHGMRMNNFVDADNDGVCDNYNQN